MADWGNSDVGGRPRTPVGQREHDRSSRRLQLTRSLTPPRTPEPAKPELPHRSYAGGLPRPRSISPPPSSTYRRPVAPPSVTGSALSAKIERASLARAKSASAAAPGTPAPPKTRARFVKQTMDVADDSPKPTTVDDATTPPAQEPGQDEPKKIEERPLSAREAAAGAAERRMKDSRHETGQETGVAESEETNKGEVGDGGVGCTMIVDPRSPSAFSGGTASVLGIAGDQFQASALLRKNKNKSPRGSAVRFNL